jgi:hypothetical protein
MQEFNAANQIMLNRIWGVGIHDSAWWLRRVCWTALKHSSNKA